MTQDWKITKEPRKPVRLETGGYGSGIVLELRKGKKTLDVWGYYDSMVGISGGSIEIDDMLSLIGLKAVPR